jgi:hypothetical protein
MFADKIRSANTEHEIYFLLTAYIEVVRNSRELRCGMPAHIAHLPLDGMADLRSRFDQLMMALDRASKSLDDESCTVIREGVHIVGIALYRLNMLHKQRVTQQSISLAGLDAQAA